MLPEIGWKTLSPTLKAFSPEILIMAIPPSPRGVAIAAIVSSNILFFNEDNPLFEYQHCGLPKISGLFHSFFFEGNGVAPRQWF